MTISLASVELASSNSRSRSWRFVFSANVRSSVSLIRQSAMEYYASYLKAMLGIAFLVGKFAVAPSTGGVVLVKLVKLNNLLKSNVLFEFSQKLLS